MIKGAIDDRGEIKKTGIKLVGQPVVIQIAL